MQLDTASSHTLVHTSDYNVTTIDAMYSSEEPMYFLRSAHSLELGLLRKKQVTSEKYTSHQTFNR